MASIDEHFKYSCIYVRNLGTIMERDEGRVLWFIGNHSIVHVSI